MVAVSEVPRISNITGYTEFLPGRVYECRVVIIQEDDGYSVHAADLRGAVSQGDTVEEAMHNIADALQGVLMEYRGGGKIPWSKVEIEGDVVGEKRILVNV